MSRALWALKERGKAKEKANRLGDNVCYFHSLQAVLAQKRISANQVTAAMAVFAYRLLGFACISKKAAPGFCLGLLQNSFESVDAGAVCCSAGEADMEVIVMPGRVAEDTLGSFSPRVLE